MCSHFCFVTCSFLQSLQGCLDITNKTATSRVHFSPQTLALFLPFFPFCRLLFFFTLNGTSDRNCLSSLLSLLFGWIPGHSFFGTLTRPLSWPEEAHLLSHLQFRIVFILLPLTYSLITFFGQKVNCFIKTFQKIQYQRIYLCFFVRLASYFLVFAKTDAVFC